VASLLYRHAAQAGLLIPTERVTGASPHDAKYEGGYYQEPCAVLDYASLYPSIMMAHNLCYSTIVPAYRVKEF
jgi:DNA polymerase delta subunit 1